MITNSLFRSLHLHHPLQSSDFRGTNSFNFYDHLIMPSIFNQFQLLPSQYNLSEKICYVSTFQSLINDFYSHMNISWYRFGLCNTLLAPFRNIIVFSIIKYWSTNGEYLILYLFELYVYTSLVYHNSQGHSFHEHKKLIFVWNEFNTNWQFSALLSLSNLPI